MKNKLVTLVRERVIECGYEDAANLTYNLVYALENIPSLELHSCLAENSSILFLLLRWESKDPSECLLRLKIFHTKLQIESNISQIENLASEISQSSREKTALKDTYLFAIIQRAKKEIEEAKKRAAEEESNKAKEPLNNGDVEEDEVVVMKTAPLFKKPRIGVRTHARGLLALPEDALSKITSFAPLQTWGKLASTHSIFQNILFHGSENILYSVFYFFANNDKLLQRRNHGLLCEILKRIASMDVNMFTLSSWKKYDESWTLNPLLKMIRKYPETFENHVDGVEKLMEIARWSAKDAAVCSIGTIYQRGIESLALFEHGSFPDDFVVYKNRFAENGNHATLGEFCRKNLDNLKLNKEEKSSNKAIYQFWPYLARLHEGLAFKTKDILITQSMIQHYSSCTDRRMGEELLKLAKFALLKKTPADKWKLVEWAVELLQLPPITAAYVYKSVVKICYANGVKLAQLPSILKENQQLVFLLVEIYPSLYKAVASDSVATQQLAELAILGEVKTPVESGTGLEVFKFKSKGQTAMLKFAPAAMKNDRKVALAATKRNYSCYHTLSDALKSDPDFIKEMIIHSPRLLEIQNSNLRAAITDETVAFAASEYVRLNVRTKKVRKAWQSTLRNIAEAHWKNEKIFFSLLPTIAEQHILKPEYLAHYLTLYRSEDFFKRVVTQAICFLQHPSVKLDIFKDFSREERQQIVENSCSNIHMLRYLTPSLFREQKDLIMQRMQKEIKLFSKLPAFARSDINICKDVVKRDISFFYHVCFTVQQDTMETLQLIQEIPAILQYPRLDKIQFPARVIIAFLSNRSFTSISLKIKSLKVMHEYFELPLLIRRDKEFQLALQKANSTFTFWPSQVSHQSKIIKHSEDPERETAIHRIISKFRSASQVVWKYQPKKTEKDDEETETDEEDNE